MTAQTIAILKQEELCKDNKPYPTRCWRIFFERRRKPQKHLCLMVTEIEIAQMDWDRILEDDPRS